jgi:hypothetical protein
MTVKTMAAVSVTELLMGGSTRAKLYELSSDSSNNSVTILPGIGYGKAVGSFLCYTISSAATGNTFNFSLADVPDRKKFTIMFLK